MAPLSLFHKQRNPYKTFAIRSTPQRIRWPVKEVFCSIGPVLPFTSSEWQLSHRELDMIKQTCCGEGQLSALAPAEWMEKKCRVVSHSHYLHGTLPPKSQNSNDEMTNSRIYSCSSQQRVVMMAASIFNSQHDTSKLH